MDWEHLAKLAPLGTAFAALSAFVLAIISLIIQRKIATKRAAIDFFLKTEMDGNMRQMYDGFRGAVKEFARKKEVGLSVEDAYYQPICSYLDVHELMAVGV